MTTICAVRFKDNKAPWVSGVNPEPWRVIMGADTGIYDEYQMSNLPRLTQKIIRVSDPDAFLPTQGYHGDHKPFDPKTGNGDGAVLIGISGSWRLRNILNQSFSFKEYSLLLSSDKQEDFSLALQRTLEGQGYTVNSPDLSNIPSIMPLDAAIMVGIRGRLFVIASDYSVVEYEEFAAMGRGAAYALGSLYNSQPPEPKPEDTGEFGQRWLNSSPNNKQLFDYHYHRVRIIHSLRASAHFDAFTRAPFTWYDDEWDGDENIR